MSESERSGGPFKILIIVAVLMGFVGLLVAMASIGLIVGLGLLGSQLDQSFQEIDRQVQEP